MQIVLQIKRIKNELSQLIWNPPKVFQCLLIAFLITFIIVGFSTGAWFEFKFLLYRVILTIRISVRLIRIWIPISRICTFIWVSISRIGVFVWVSIDFVCVFVWVSISFVWSDNGYTFMSRGGVLSFLFNRPCLVEYHWQNYKTNFDKTSDIF